MNATPRPGSRSSQGRPLEPLWCATARLSTFHGQQTAPSRENHNGADCRGAHPPPTRWRHVSEDGKNATPRPGSCSSQRRPHEPLWLANARRTTPLGRQAAQSHVDHNGAKCPARINAHACPPQAYMYHPARACRAKCPGPPSSEGGFCRCSMFVLRCFLFDVRYPFWSFNFRSFSCPFVSWVGVGSSAFSCRCPLYVARSSVCAVQCLFLRIGVLGARRNTRPRQQYVRCLQVH